MICNKNQEKCACTNYTHENITYIYKQVKLPLLEIICTLTVFV